MILSSNDILNKLAGDAIIRSCARISIVDGKPGFDTGEYLYIYIDKYPTVQDFQATWKIWILDGGHDYSGLAMEALAVILPGFENKGGYYCTTDFASERTVVKTETEKQLEAIKQERKEYNTAFDGISQRVNAALEGVQSGQDGRDGKDGLQGPAGPAGRDGADGRDGRDLDATEVQLEDLQNVEPGIGYEKGQVLTWDGDKWTNLYPRSSTFIGGGGGSNGGGEASGQINSDTIVSETLPTSRKDDKGPLQDGDTWYKPSSGQLFIYLETIDAFAEINTGGGGGGGIPEAPLDGKQYARQNADWSEVQATDSGIEEAPLDGQFYVRQNGQWVNLKNALDQLGVPVDEPVDGGNYTTGFSAAVSDTPADGGDFTTAGTDAVNDIVLDGGNYSTGESGSTLSNGGFTQ